MSPARSLILLITALCALFFHAAAAPTPNGLEARAPASNYWLANIQHQGTVWGNSDTSYQVFRNVKDFGAVGDGVTDDTAAINRAISSGNRCGQGCPSSTLSPALVFFPPGTYLISSPIVMYYYTQVVGDPNNTPNIKASASFSGIAMFDSDPYMSGGANWYTNQNNFFRQVRNFVFDMTSGPNGATGIHWQVAQATSLQNLWFKMTPGSNQQGIFMDNGSGGFFSDLLFTGGKTGAFLGNQQFTTRNLTFNGCSTAVYMNWNWGWTLSGLTISNANVGVDISSQSAGSAVIMDSSFGNSQIAVKSAYKTSGNNPPTLGTLVLDNVDMSGVGTPVQGPNGVVLSTKGKITSWTSGNGYSKTNSGTATQGTLNTPPQKNSNLLDSTGKIYSRQRPQYGNVAASSILSAKSNGCKGDGKTIDTAAVQAFLNKVASTSGAVAFFDHGAYLVDNTITVPANIKIVGEVWPLIVANSASFNDGNNPKPVFKVGTAGQSGSVEISDLLFATNGPAAGAIMVEWNLNSAKGASGMWDSHVRIGGSAGSNLQKSQCPAGSGSQPNKNCAGVFLMFHAAPSSGGVYLENTWFWVADHDMEDNGQAQTNVYSARGALFRSTNGPTWLWGTASEHSMFYNYQFDGISANYGLFSGFMQTETPYFQPNPTSLAISWLPTNSNYDDPSFSVCSGSSSSVPCQEAWGLRVVNSQSVLVYSTGFYNFFNNYNQDCVNNNNCQQNMIEIVNSKVDMFAVTTKASVNMIRDDAMPNAGVTDAKNRDVFGATIAYYQNH